jgi:hypothetical protein
MYMVWFLVGSVRHALLMKKCSITSSQEVGDAKKFSLTRAKEMVQYCAASYCHKETWANTIPYVTNTTHIWHEETETSGFVGYMEKHAEQRSQIIVAFAGTDPLVPANIWSDLQFLPVPFLNCSGCSVHVGFLNAWIKVKKQVIVAVSDLKTADPLAAVYVTGHSLGAAIALHAALGLEDQYGVPIEALHMFGSPRVGNPAFSLHAQTRFSQDTLYRITNGQDIIVQLPFVFMGYSHVHGEVNFPDHNNDTHYRLCTGAEDPCCALATPRAKLLNVRAHMKYVGLDFAENFQFCTLFKFFGIDQKHMHAQYDGIRSLDDAHRVNGALADLDKDGDGNLDSKEMPPDVLRVLESLDSDPTNDDGRLDATELAQMANNEVVARAWQASGPNIRGPSSIQ